MDDDARSDTGSTDRHREWRKYAFDEEIGAGAVLLADASLDDVPRFREVWRRISRAGSTPTPPEVRRDVLEVASDDGPIIVHRYAPRAPQTDAAAVLLIHSGAFVGGSVESVHGQACDMVAALGVVVVAVEYRLAPENPFPAGFNDCYRVLCWMSDEADALDIDPLRIAVHGTSAGAGLATALALRCREENGPRIRFLFLVSPEVDDRLETESMRKFTDTPGFTRGDAEISWRLYLGEVAPGSRDVHPYAAPARAADYRGLPPTYLALMEFDPLRDEGMELGMRLLRDDVPLELHIFPGTFHGSSALHYADVSRREADEEIAVMRRRLLDGSGGRTS